MSEGRSCLPFWEGFQVVDLRVDAETVHITLEPGPRARPRCGGCRQSGLPVHEYCRRRIRDLPMLGKAVLLEVTLRRVACSDCGFRMEAVSWLDRHARLTRRLADAVSALCARMATAHVAELFGLHWSTVRALDQRRFEAVVGGLPEAEPSRAPRVAWTSLGSGGPPTASIWCSDPAMTSCVMRTVMGLRTMPASAADRAGTPAGVALLSETMVMGYLLEMRDWRRPGPTPVGEGQAAWRGSWAAGSIRRLKAGRLCSQMRAVSKRTPWSQA